MARARQTEPSIKVETKLAQSTFDELEAWRHGLPVVPPRATAIRTLIESALQRYLETEKERSRWQRSTTN